MQTVLPLMARIFISLIFILSGINKIMDPESTQQFMAAQGIPATGFFLIGAIILEVGGGLAVLLGYNAKRGALALTIFLIPTTFIFHTNFAEKIQMIQFMKNLAVLGGLFMIMAFGPGSISFDERKKG